MSHLGVFKNWVMRKIVGCKTEEVIGDWRNLYNEELCDFYSSQNIILAIKLRQMRWVGDLACKCSAHLVSFCFFNSLLSDSLCM